MIRIKSTPNLTGVTICGNYEDLYEVVEAIYKVTVSIDDFDNKNEEEYIAISTRMLGLAYDLRHAYQGDRDIKLIDNGMNKEIMKYHKLISSQYNVDYSCNYLYPEMIYCIIAISELILLRVKKLSKTSDVYKGIMDKNVVYDKAINTLRLFQSAFIECVEELLPKKSYTIWKNLFSEQTFLYRMVHQHMDIVNLDYINMTKEQRLKAFHATTKRITEFYNYEEYDEILQDVREFAYRNNMPIEDVQLNIDYPDEIEW